MKFDYAISVLEGEKNKLESEQKCFKNKFVFQNDVMELEQAIKILKEGKK